MTPTDSTSRPESGRGQPRALRPRLRRGLRNGLRAGLPTLVALGVAVALVARAFREAGMPAATVPVAAGTWLVLAALVVGLRARGGGSGFGAANRVTAARAAIVAVLAGLVPGAGALAAPAMQPWLWAATGLGLLALALDGLDGWLARRRNEASDFGARFDMETDAALGLVIALLLWRSGETGAWVLGLGVPRYAFVAAAWRWPALDGELRPSLRRKAVCVVQIGALCAMLSPLVQAPASSLAGGVALVLLGWSFVRDARRLLRGGAALPGGGAARA